MNFFISDIHFGFDRKTNEIYREKLLIQFLNYISVNGERLFIVGDLFDFWFEYQSVIPRQYFHILSALKNITEKGIKVYYITGNHDFWMENFFKKELKIQIYDGICRFNLENKKFYITHGDGIAKKDKGYRLLKRLLRMPILILLYRLLHPDMGFTIANYFSRLSRNYRHIKNRDQEYIEYARQHFKEGYDYVVMGHTHRPQEYHENKHTYVNTGNWMDMFSYGVYQNGRLSLKYWPNNPKTTKNKCDKNK